jgi:S1-C subfamily serine protease
MTDVSGHFRLGGIGPGNVDLTAVAPAAGRGSARAVRVEAGRTTERVRIQLEPGPEPEEPTATGNVALTLSERTGPQIVVAQVPEGSEAERTGMVVGDVVLAIDGERPGSMRRARALLSGPAGSDVVIELEHQGARKTVRVTREVVRR